MIFETINIQEKLGKFTDQWSPKIIAQMNDIQLKLVKVAGDFIWHKHKDTDEVFMVLEGQLRIDDKTVEIPLIYFDLKYIGKGYGSETMRFVEEWIRENWPAVKKIFLDTIIPKYNGGFYNKIGYKELGESKCIFPGKEVSATRFEKKLKQK